MSRRPVLLILFALIGLASCGEDGRSSDVRAPSSEPSEEDRSFAACLERAGARPVQRSADVAFLRGTTTEGRGNSAVTNGLVAAGRGVVRVEWMPLNGPQRWRVYSRSYETEANSPDYEGIWQRIIRASPDIAVIAVQRAGSRASLEAARRCIASA